MTRRSAIALLPLAATASQTEQSKPYGTVRRTLAGQTVFVRGEGRRAVVLLHEINGLSPGCADFAAVLSAAGYQVWMPLLFGRPLWHYVLLGAVSACVGHGFRCSSEGAAEQEVETPAVTRIQRLVEEIAAQPGVSSAAVIGMCLTGAFGLACMGKVPKVRAVVVSQPALPMGKSKQDDVGISAAAMKRAKSSGIPIYGLRFKADPISTPDRMKFLHDYFGEPQFSEYQLETPHDYHETLTHKLHAVLTGPFGASRDEARARVIRFLDANLS